MLHNKLKARAYIIVSVVFFFGGLFAQPDKEEIYTIVEEMAEFPGGIEAMKQYVITNTSYPKNRTATNQKGKCFVKFVVNEKGGISDIQILKGVPDCPECDKEAVRVIKTMPIWRPGKMNGRPVSMYYKVPVEFNLPVVAPVVPLSAEEQTKAKADAEAKAVAEARAKAEAERIAKLKSEAENKSNDRRNKN